MPALTLRSGGERPPAPFTDRPNRLDAIRLGELGGAAQQLLRWLDSRGGLSPGPARDLSARCRRRHIALAPAFRSYRSRLGFWLWTGAIFELFALAGAWPSAPSVPLPPDTSPATPWPVLALAG